MPINFENQFLPIYTEWNKNQLTGRAKRESERLLEELKISLADFYEALLAKPPLPVDSTVIASEAKQSRKMKFSKLSGKHRGTLLPKKLDCFADVRNDDKKLHSRKMKFSKLSGKHRGTLLPKKLDCFADVRSNDGKRQQLENFYYSPEEQIKRIDRCLKALAIADETPFLEEKIHSFVIDQIHILYPKRYLKNNQNIFFVQDMIKQLCVILSPAVKEKPIEDDAQLMALLESQNIAIPTYNAYVKLAKQALEEIDCLQSKNAVSVRCLSTLKEMCKAIAQNISLSDIDIDIADFSRDEQEKINQLKDWFELEKQNYLKISYQEIQQAFMDFRKKGWQFWRQETSYKKLLEGLFKISTLNQSTQGTQKSDWLIKELGAWLNTQAKNGNIETALVGFFAKIRDIYEGVRRSLEKKLTADELDNHLWLRQMRSAYNQLAAKQGMPYRLNIKTTPTPRTHTDFSKLKRRRLKTNLARFVTAISALYVVSQAIVSIFGISGLSLVVPLSLISPVGIALCVVVGMAGLVASWYLVKNNANISIKSLFLQKKTQQPTPISEKIKQGAAMGIAVVTSLILVAFSVVAASQIPWIAGLLGLSAAAAATGYGLIALIGVAVFIGSVLMMYSAVKYFMQKENLKKIRDLFLTPFYDEYFQYRTRKEKAKHVIKSIFYGLFLSATVVLLALEVLVSVNAYSRMMSQSVLSGWFQLSRRVADVLALAIVWIFNAPTEALFTGRSLLSLIKLGMTKISGAFKKDTTLEIQCQSDKNGLVQARQKIAILESEAKQLILRNLNEKTTLAVMDALTDKKQTASHVHTLSMHCMAPALIGKIFEKLPETHVHHLIIDTINLAQGETLDFFSALKKSRVDELTFEYLAPGQMREVFSLLVGSVIKKMHFKHTVREIDLELLAKLGLETVHFSSCELSSLQSMPQNGKTLSLASKSILLENPTPGFCMALLNCIDKEAGIQITLKSITEEAVRNFMQCMEKYPKRVAAITLDSCDRSVAACFSNSIEQHAIAQTLSALRCMNMEKDTCDLIKQTFKKINQSRDTQNKPPIFLSFPRTRNFVYEAIYHPQRSFFPLLEKIKQFFIYLCTGVSGVFNGLAVAKEGNVDFNPSTIEETVGIADSAAGVLGNVTNVDEMYHAFSEQAVGTKKICHQPENTSNIEITDWRLPLIATNHMTKFSIFKNEVSSKPAVADIHTDQSHMRQRH